MKNKIILVVFIFFSLLNGANFVKGDKVIIKKGYPICVISKNDSKAVDKLINSMYQLIDSADSYSIDKPFHVQFSKDSADFCVIFNHNQKGVFLKKLNKHFSLLNEKDSYAIVENEAIGIKEDNHDSTKQQQEQAKYFFVGIDKLEAFPSDYVGKKIYLICKKGSVSEDRKGGYEILLNCMKSDYKYDFGPNNPFKIKIHTNSKTVAKEIINSGNKEKYILGTVRKNNEKYALFKNIFEIKEVQFK